jgi:hypothetical protein
MRNPIKALIPVVALLASLLVSLPTAQNHAEAKTKQKPKPSPSPTINLEHRRTQAASRSASRHPYASPKYNQIFAYSYMQSRYHWNGKQFTCLVTLWNRESGWRADAHNRSSGAHGIPQSLPGNKMAKFGKNWRTDPQIQIKWGLNYIKHRYTTPCSALNHSYSYGWY